MLKKNSLQPLERRNIHLHNLPDFHFIVLFRLAQALWLQVTHPDHLLQNNPHLRFLHLLPCLV
jgi:hypothetical protein